MNHRFLIYLILIAALVACSGDDDFNFSPLNINAPCIVLDFLDANTCPAATIERNDNGQVVSVTNDCFGPSYTFEYDNDGNIILYSIISGPEIFDIEFEYDDNGRLMRLNDITYTYPPDSIIAWNSEGERIKKYWNLDASGRPGNYKEINQPGLCEAEYSYKYNLDGNYLRIDSSPCQYRAETIEFEYYSNFFNPDPIPANPFIYSNPFTLDSKHALARLYSMGGGPSGSDLKYTYKYEWDPGTSKLSVFRTTRYGDEEPSEPELIRIYTMDCQ